jgi:serine O-acetyltransferase
MWRMGVRPKLARAPLSLVYRWLFRHCRNRYGIELPYTVRLGQGVVIEHQGAIVVHGNCEIGDRCIIRQGCTLGLRHLDDLTAAPSLEDGVELGAGAVVLGRIRLGAGAKVGANAVVLDDVPAGATVWGIPARGRVSVSDDGADDLRQH